MASTDYKHGDMEVTGQKGTFSGFMATTIYGGAAIVYILLFPILLFAVGLSWFPSLVAAVIIAFLIGFALKLKGSWYVFVVVMAILTAIGSIIFA